MKKISVAMATYNGSQHLEEQLASLLAQTRLPSELVICDDGSTDATVEILRSFAAKAPFEVRIERNASNLGVLRNFEKALSLCRGEIVFLSDQDDYWLPDKIARIVDLFEARPEALVALNDKRITDEDLTPTDATMLSNIRGFGSPDSCFVAGCCSAFRREWLEIALPIPDGPPAHDSWLAGLAHRLEVVAICEEPLQLYRRHGSNVSQNVYSNGRQVGLNDRLATEFSALRGDTAAAQVAYWDHFLGWHRAERTRIEERSGRLAELGLASSAAAALATIDRQIAAEQERRRFAALSRPGRIAPVWRLWRAGGYSAFSGWKSAVKDVIQ